MAAMNAFTIDDDDGADIIDLLPMPGPDAPPAAPVVAPPPGLSVRAPSAGADAPAAPAAAAPAPAPAPAAVPARAPTPQPPAFVMPSGVTTITEALDAMQSNAALITEAEQHLQQLLAKQQAIMLAERLLEQDKVAALLADRSAGFHRGRPVAALVAARCLLQWGALASPGGGAGAGAPPDDDGAALLRRLSDLLFQQLRAADEDEAAAHASGLAHARAGGGGGGGSPPRGGAGGAAAYWLSVSSALLALVLRAARRAAASSGAPGGGAHEGRSQAMRRGVAQLQRKLAEGMGELHLGSRLGDGFHHLFARRAGSGGGAAAGAGGTPRAATAAAAGAGSGAGAGAGAGAAGGEAAGCLEPPPSLASASSLASAASSFLGSAAAPQGGSQHTHSSSQHSATDTHVHAHAAPPVSHPAPAAVAAAPAPAAPAAAAQQGGHRALEEFMAALDIVVQRSFMSLCDQLRRRLLPVLANCMHHFGTASVDAADLTIPSNPPPPGAGLGLSEGGAAGAGEAAGGEGASADAEAIAATQEAVLDTFRDWAELVSVVSDALSTLRGERVPPPLVRAAMQQMLGFVNSQLFNQLLLRPELCRAGNARYALRGLKQLDGLLLQVAEGELGEAAWAALNHTRQALQFLALERKGELSVDDITQELCPALSQQQVYRLCTTAWDDTPGADPSPVSGEVLEALHTRHAAAAAAAAGGISVAGVTLGGGDRGPNLSNQGLVVTCLLEEPGLPPFITAAAGGGAAATNGGGRAGPEEVLSWLDGRDWSEGVPVPQQLLVDCPPEVFAFLQERTSAL